MPKNLGLDASEPKSIQVALRPVVCTGPLLAPAPLLSKRVCHPEDRWRLLLRQSWLDVMCGFCCLQSLLAGGDC